MTLGEKLIDKAIKIAFSQGFEKYNKTCDILQPFFKQPDELDLETICELEALLDEELIRIPTKQEWRKIKLDKLNEICNEEEF